MLTFMIDHKVDDNAKSKLIFKVFTQWLPLFAEHNGPQRQKQQNHLMMTIFTTIIKVNTQLSIKSPMTTKLAKTP